LSGLLRWYIKRLIDESLGESPAGQPDWPGCVAKTVIAEILGTETGVHFVHTES